MQQRKLGNTGLTVSALGFGCWEMGNPEYGSSDDKQMIAAVNRAIDLGVTLFDTAPNYGFGGSGSSMPSSTSLRSISICQPLHGIPRPRLGRRSTSQGHSR